MRNFLFTANGFINLDNVIYMTPPDGVDALTHTRMIAPGVDIKLAMPYPEVKAMIEKLIKDQYEYDLKWYQYRDEKSSQDQDQRIQKLIDAMKGGHG